LGQAFWKNRIFNGVNSERKVSLLEQAAFEKRRRKNNLNPLEHLLVNAVHGERRRTLIRNDDWATEQVTFEVK
jgi:hypothetical protein